MNKLTLFIIALLLSPVAVAATPIEQRMADYNPDGNLTFDAKRGEALWHQQRMVDGKQRDCNTCHGKDLTQAGKHVKTGKVIEPMAYSANKERFTKLKKVKKWFKRNCKWTYGRECTTQEKGDLLKYLSQY